MTTMAEVLDDFLTDLHRKVRPNTLRAYRSDLTAAALHLVGPLSTLSLREIEAYLTAGSAAESTIARRATSLKRFLDWTVRHQYSTDNPLRYREPVRRQRKLPRPIRSIGEREALEKAIRRAKDPYRLIFWILRETGMRAGEVLQLTVGDMLLDPGREALRIREAKNRSERVVILGPHATPNTLRGLRAWLRTPAMQQAQPHEPLFRSNRQTRISYDALNYQWGLLCHAAGLVNAEHQPRYTLHQLRHTKGTELIEEGKRLDVVQRALGHRDPRSTQLYAELSDEQLRAELERD